MRKEIIMLFKEVHTMKKFLSSTLSIVMLSSLLTSTCVASPAKTIDSSNSFSESELESLINNTAFLLDAEDGATATYIIYKDKNGDAVITDYDSEIMPYLDYEPGDGVLEYAVFHLGFKNWTSSSTTGDLYYTLTADERIKTVAGTAYVEHPNLLVSLIQGPYYKDSWYHSIPGGSTYISKTLKDDIDVGNINEVSFASLAITAGADVASVSEVLGHSDKAVTLRMYTHSDDESRRRASQIVQEAIKKAGQG